MNITKKYKNKPKKYKRISFNKNKPKKSKSRKYRKGGTHSTRDYISNINRQPIKIPITELKELNDNDNFCKDIIEKPPDTRYPITKIGEGIFGKVIKLRLGRTYYACKIIKILDEDIDTIINEINFQIEASNLGIAPNIYDYYLL